MSGGLAFIAGQAFQRKNVSLCESSKRVHQILNNLSHEEE
jgi:hypothetical protein